MGKNLQRARKDFLIILDEHTKDEEGKDGTLFFACCNEWTQSLLMWGLKYPAKVSHLVNQ